MPTATAALRFWSFRADTKLADGTVRYLWPERYGPAWYATMLATLKRRRYSGEMNGEPIKIGKVFLADWFPTYKRLPKGVELRAYLWCDPAFGRSASSCYKAVVVVATDGKRYYVVDAWLRQGEPVGRMIDAMYDLFLDHEAVGLRHGGAESDFGQDLRLERDLDDAADEHGYPLPIGFDSNRIGSKEARIESMEGIVSRGRVLWPEPGGGHDHNEDDVATLKDQMLGYPDDYDDGPDALESALRRIRHVRGSKPFYKSLDEAAPRPPPLTPTPCPPPPSSSRRAASPAPSSRSSAPRSSAAPSARRSPASRSSTSPSWRSFGRPTTRSAQRSRA